MGEKSPTGVSGLDLAHFNSFPEGYLPYTEDDLRKLIAPAKAVASLFAAPLIAEIGSGSGQFSQELSTQLNNPKAAFYGVDIAEIILSKYPFNKVHASAFEIPLPGAFFDVICYPASLHHLAPIKKALSEMDRLLKPGGYVYLFEPNLFHPHRLLFMNFTWLYHKMVKINDTPINPAGLRKSLAADRYEIVYFEYINIEFKGKSVLQTWQKRASNSFFSKLFPALIQPWFMLVAKKSQIVPE